MDNRLEIVLAAKDATGRAFAKVTDRVKHLSKSVVNFNTVLVGAAGATGMGYFVKSQLEAADAIAKTADMVGVSTRSLQEYRFIADRAGVATSQLDKGLGAFSKRLGELRSGTGSLNGYLKKNNEELRQQLLAAKSTDEALVIFLNTLGEIENQSDKSALSAAAFSRTAGISMANMVKGGADALEDVRNEFHALGLEIDEQFLREAEAAVDAFTNLEYVIKARLMGAIVQLAPEVSEMVGQFTDWVVANDEFITRDVPEYVKDMADAFKDLNVVMEPVLWTLDHMNNRIKAFFEAAKGNANFFEVMWANPTKLKKMVEEMEREYTPVGTVISKPINSSTPGYPHSNPRGLPAPGSGGGTNQKSDIFGSILLDDDDRFAREVEEFEAFLESGAESAEEFKRSIDGLFEPILLSDDDRFAQEIGEFEEYLANGAEAAEEFKRSIDGLFESVLLTEDDRFAKEVEEFENFVAGVEDSSESMAETIKHATTGYASHFANETWEMVKNWEGGLDQMLSSYLDMLGQMVWQKHVMEPALAWGMQGISTLAGVMGIPSFDTGGMMGSDGKKKHFPAYLGEGEISGYPAQLAKLFNGSKGGGLVVNNTINIESSGHGEDDARLANTIAQTLDQRIRMALRDEKRVGGLLNRSISGGMV